MTTKDHLLQMHWGKAITLFFICYISFLIFVVFKSTTIHQSLVTDSYYQEDLNYQAHYDKLVNQKSNNNAPSIVYDHVAQIININSDKKGLSDIDVLMYRPSDNRRDKTFHYDTMVSPITVDVKAFIPGRWIVKLSWTDGNQPYYTEEEILVVR